MIYFPYHPFCKEKFLRVKIKLLALYRDRAGISDFELDVPAPTKVSMLLGEVLKRYPSVTSDKFRVVVAVNGEYQEQDHIVNDGDEVALIPPVSGGSF